MSEDYTSLSGLLMYHFSRIPRLNEKIIIENYEITILKIQRRSVHTVVLKEIFNDNHQQNENEIKKAAAPDYRI